MQLLNKNYIFITIMSHLMLACVDKRKPEVTPWGTVVGEEQQTGNGKYSLDDIIGS